MAPARGGEVCQDPAPVRTGGVLSRGAISLTDAMPGPFLTAPQPGMGASPSSPSQPVGDAGFHCWEQLCPLPRAALARSLHPGPTVHTEATAGALLRPSEVSGHPWPGALDAPLAPAWHPHHRPQAEVRCPVTWQFCQQRASMDSFLAGLACWAIWLTFLPSERNS